MEHLDLTVAITPTSRTFYRIGRLVLDYDSAVIQAYVKGSDGVEVLVEYTGAPATDLMNTLNTVNMSTTSMHKRALQKFVVDGKLPAGTVTGTPE